MKKTLLIITLLLLSVASVSAEQVIINSNDWRDVIVGLQYAASIGDRGRFVVSEEQGQALISELGDDKDILLITGNDQIMPGMRSLLISQGYTVDELESKDPVQLSHDLALQANTTSLVVISDDYGYDAISVANYANIRGSSVVFASDETKFLIEDKNPEELLLYGQIPSAVYDDIQEFNPIIINNQDRFEDNFELVKRFIEFENQSTLLLTNGEFIEEQLVTDNKPVLFTGRQTVPDEVIDLLKEQDFRIGIIIGNSLAPNAHYIKESAQMSIFIKFAKGKNQQQVSLDTFPLPVPNPLLQISDSEYDQTTRKLFVTYQNPGDVPTYFSGSFKTPSGTVEDKQIVFIEAGTYKTVAYDSEPPQGDINYTIFFGAYPATLDLMLQGFITPKLVRIDDKSNVTVTDASYDTTKQRFVITIDNNGGVPSYVLTELVDVRIGGNKMRLGASVEQISAGRQKKVYIPAVLSEKDIERNKEIRVELFFGERENTLIKEYKRTFAFKTSSSISSYTLLLVGGVLLIIILVVLFGKKKKKPYRHKYHYNHRR